MKRRAAETAEDQHQREHHAVRRQADQRQHRDASERTGEQQHARPPAVGDVAEAELRHRVGQLEAHLQRAGGGEREIEVGDEQRQQRREDVAVAVDEEVRARQQQDGAVQPERSPRTRSRREPAGSRVIAAIVDAVAIATVVELADAQQPRGRGEDGHGDADRQRQAGRLCSEMRVAGQPASSQRRYDHDRGRAHHRRRGGDPHDRRRADARR